MSSGLLDVEPLPVVHAGDGRGYAAFRAFAADASSERIDVGTLVLERCGSFARP